MKAMASEDIWETWVAQRENEVSRRGQDRLTAGREGPFLLAYPCSHPFLKIRRVSMFYFPKEGLAGEVVFYRL